MLEILVFYDVPFACPKCGARLETGEPVDIDDDGPIFKGRCASHGEFLVQAAEQDTVDGEAP
ncbi:hypothetical protein SAMN03159338_1522 [Sphingomonas sp. NFR04]|jgi:hypothetical protein|nr:hypothetical protein SAMN03159338_1522 [Sphingomonas sp. NFR04]